MKASETVDKTTTFPVISVWSSMKDMSFLVNTKALWKLLIGCKRTGLTCATTWQICCILEIVFFFLCSYIILHKLIGLERSWRHCCIYWKIQRIRCTITLFWKAQAWLKKILCFLCKNYTCSKNQNKQNNQTQEQQNSSTPELFFITHLPSWRTNIYMTMPFPNYKQINHIHLFLKARVKDQLILLTYLTST